MNPEMPPNYRTVLDRFIAACQQDGRILAAFLAGSYARCAADPFSDLDLGLITTDESFNDFSTNHRLFIRQLGEPLFLETFRNPNHVFYIFDNGVEGELAMGCLSQFETIHSGPYRVLLDKAGVLTGVTFSGVQPDPAEQAEKLRRLFSGFWHEWMHFTTALGRGHLWWAQGQLESLRGFCLSLMRLRHNFFDPDAGEEPYFKVEYEVPLEQLQVLLPTLGPLDKSHLFQAGLLLARIFHELALPLSQAHGIAYPEALENMMVKKLEELSA